MKLNLKIGSIGNHKNGFGLYLFLNVLLCVVFQTQSQFKFKCILVYFKPKTLNPTLNPAISFKPSQSAMRTTNRRPTTFFARTPIK